LERQPVHEEVKQVVRGTYLNSIRKRAICGSGGYLGKESDWPEK